MHSGEIHRPDGSAKAFIVALLLHALLVVLLVTGVRSQMPDKPAEVSVIQATVVQDDAVKQQIEQLKRDNEKLLASEMRKEKQALETAQAKQKEQEKQEKQKSLDLAKQKELEMQRLSAEKKKSETLKSAETQKQAAELKKQAAAEQQKAEQQKKDALLRRRQVESGLQEQLAAEEKERNQAKAAALAERQRGEIARYEDIIRQKVTRSWARPPGAREGLECVVLVRVVPGGAVLSTQVVRSSGNSIFDRSAENAINRASPLPVPDDKSMFEHFREFEFKFRPEG